MARPVFILGGAQTDFARNLARDGGDVGALVRDTVLATLEAVAVDPADLGTVHVANAFGELFSGQGHLGAMPASVLPGLDGIPASRHEAACASGGVALLAAMSEIEAGRYETALVLGVEQERNVPGDVAARHLGAAGWVGHDEARPFPWPHAFSRVGDAYAERYGLDHRHLAALAEKAFANAKRNPRAQTRGWAFTKESFGEDDTANPVVDGRIRRQDCSQLTDGGAGLVLASAEGAERYASRRGVPMASLARVLGWGHTTSGLSLEPKLARKDSPYVLPSVRRAIEAALRRADVGVDQLHGLEVHDCFTVTEYMAIDHFGLTPPGESFRAIEDGSIARGGRLPVNPSGGLVGGGHPVGATGVRMVLDAAMQVTGRAEAMQVEGARLFGTLNLGGSAATVVSFVVGRG